jgi:hypothetical protein
VSTLSGDTPQRGDTSQSRDTPHNEQTTSNVSGDDNSAATTRRSPQGSFTERDIRRPPLYTSAPSRPYSSLPFTSHTAISPLSSPRHEVSNETRATSSSTRGRVDRVAPAGSPVEPERMNPVPTTSRQFSEDRVKGLYLIIATLSVSYVFLIYLYCFVFLRTTGISKEGVCCTS